MPDVVPKGRRRVQVFVDLSEISVYGEPEDPSPRRLRMTKEYERMYEDEN